MEAQKLLKEEGIDVRVISMPSWELFAKQDQAYQDSVLSLPWDKRVSVEMLSTFGWDKYAKYHMGMDSFGASAPAKDVIGKFEFTADRLAKLCKEIVE